MSEKSTGDSVAYTNEVNAIDKDGRKEDDNTKLDRGSNRNAEGKLHRFFEQLFAGSIFANVEARGVERVSEEDRVRKVRTLPVTTPATPPIL